jgi:hypothetical protein
LQLKGIHRPPVHSQCEPSVVTLGVEGWLPGQRARFLRGSENLLSIRPRISAVKQTLDFETAFWDTECSPLIVVSIPSTFGNPAGRQLGGEDGDCSWALGRLEPCPNSHNYNNVTLFRRISLDLRDGPRRGSGGRLWLCGPCGEAGGNVARAGQSPELVVQRTSKARQISPAVVVIDQAEISVHP